MSFRSAARRLARALPYALPTLAIAMLAGCGEGGGADGMPPTPSGTAVDFSVSGQAITKARADGDAVAFLEERLVSIFEQGPQRTLEILDRDGQTAHPYTAPAGWSVVDFAVHPSGVISAVLTTVAEVRIVRLSADGVVLSDQLFQDLEAPDDPFFDYAGGVRDDTALQPVLMRDAARVAPLGESLGLVLRTGRNAVVAYRLDPDASGSYQRRWRTLVEPGGSVLGKGLITGSVDVFNALDDHVRIFADADAAGTLAIGVANDPLFNFTFQAHTEYFGEPIAATAGVLLTRLSSDDGARLGTTVIDTQVHADLYALRATSTGFALVGRVFSEQRADGTGWDAFAALVGSNGNLEAYRVLDFDRGDVLFDIAELPSGEYLALGTTAYVQNPTGASISEDAQPLLALLSGDGSKIERLAFAGGLRQNQLRSITPLRARWLVGGSTNGPGTHSGDAQRDLIFADGFLRQPAGLPGE